MARKRRHQSNIAGTLRWEKPYRRECKVKTRRGKEAILHQGEPYAWIGFGYVNEREEDRNISIALFLHSRKARSYAMRLLKQMGVRTLPDTGDLAEDAALLVQAIEEPPLPVSPRHGAEARRRGQVAGLQDTPAPAGDSHKPQGIVRIGGWRMIARRKRHRRNRRHAEGPELPAG